MYLKTKILSLFLFLGSLSLYGQTFMYSYTDPCTKEIKTIIYDMSAPIVVSYYGSTRAFTYTEMQSGVFDTWVSQVYLQYTDQPCQGILSSITTTSTTNLTTNVINTILNLNTVTSSLTAIGGIGNNIGSTVNVGTGAKEEKQNKNGKNNNGNSNNNNLPNNNSNSSSGSNNSSNGSSQENGSGGEQQNQPPNSGGEQSGSSQQGSTQGNNKTEQPNPNPPGNQSSNQSSQNNSQTTEDPTGVKEDKQKDISTNSVRTTSRAKNETQKPAILLTGDIVGLQKTTDSTQDARGTVSYTRVKGDGTASLSFSADYMVNAKIGNITAMRSWIGIKSNGDKHINLISSGFSMMPGSISNTSMFIRINSLKRFTALYGVAGSYGKLYDEELITGLAIGGFMYKGKITKKIDGTIIMAGVYSPYTKYYTESWFRNKPIIVPFFNFNYKMTSTFGIGLTGGTTYMAGQNIINYQVLLGAKLIL